MTRRRGWLVATIGLLLLGGCAAASNDVASTAASAPGFWLGLWHGYILPVTLILSLVRDDVGIYAVHNDGAGYDIGFLIGVWALLGSPPLLRVTRSRTARYPPSGDRRHHGPPPPGTPWP